MLPLYIYAYYKKVPGSAYVLLANIPFLLIVARSEFLFFGWIDYDYFSRFGHMGALVYESLAFSLLVSYYIKELNKENELQRSVLFQKEKQSALGELLVYITHQWRAPLARLSSIITLNEARLKKGRQLSNDEWMRSLNKSKEVIDFMTDTTDNFINFYVPDRKKRHFKIKEAIDTIWQIVGKEFEQEKISFYINGDSNITWHGASNDISQVILSLITNSKQIFAQRKIKNPRINILINEDDKNINIIISDNGGGTAIKPLDKLFDAYIKSDELSKVNASTGIGLYLVKNILNSYNAEIQVKQTKAGLDFTITLPKKEKIHV